MLARGGLLILLFLPLMAAVPYTSLLMHLYIGGSGIAVMLLIGLLFGIGSRRIFPGLVLGPLSPDVDDLQEKMGKIARAIILGLFIVWDAFVLFFMFTPGLWSSAISLIWLLNALSLIPIGGALLYSGLFLRSVHMVKYPIVKAELTRNLVLTVLVCLPFIILIYSADLWMGGLLFLAYAVFFWAIANLFFNDKRTDAPKGSPS